MMFFSKVTQEGEMLDIRRELLRHPSCGSGNLPLVESVISFRLSELPGVDEVVNKPSGVKKKVGVKTGV